MAIQVINIGAYGNDPAADTLRVAFDKTNQNFTEVASDITAANSAAQSAMAAVNSKYEVYDATVNTTPAGSTSEVILRAIPIPAVRAGVPGNTLANSSLFFKVHFEKLIGYACSFKVYLSTSPSSVAGLSSLYTMSSVAGTGVQPIFKTVEISPANGSGVSAVTIFDISISLAGESATTYQVGTQNITPANNYWLVFTAQNASSSGWSKYHRSELIIRKHTT